MQDPTSSLEFSVSEDDPPALRVWGQADFHNKHRLQDAFDALLASGCTRVRADLTELHYADTSAVAALVGCAVRYREVGGHIELVGASQRVSRVLNLCGAATFFVSKTEHVPVCGGAEPRVPSENYWHVTDFSLPATAEAAAVARRRVARVVRALPLGLAEGEDVVVAVGEALANAIRHGCKCNPELRISVKCVAGPRRLVIDITDPGPGFDPGLVPKPSPRTLVEGGMGIYMMRELVDEVTFTFDGPTVARLVKHLPPPRESVGDVNSDTFADEISRS